MANSFVHLRVHSEFSLYDSTVRVKKLIGAVADNGMAAVALTDQSNMYALVKFYKTAMGAGVQPILGADLWLDNPDDLTQPFRITALCQNSAGYLNLRELISKGYSHHQHYDKAIVKKRTSLVATKGTFCFAAMIKPALTMVSLFCLVRAMVILVSG